jgi:alkyl sulfatase BDS1-like metallo-beta-lactamase superfamily hydrolase
MNKRILRGLALAALTAVLAACGGSPEHTFPETVPFDVDLAAHTEEFRREVIRVTDRVHVAVGFGLANSILIEGDDGVIIVDTMESVEEAEVVKAAFDEITTKPVVAIIYTHNHADHIFGAKVFADGRDVDIYAHETTTRYIDRLFTVVRPIIAMRSYRMFGRYLDAEGLVNAGIGPHLGIDNDSTFGLLRPTKTFRDRLEVEIAGIRLVLQHAPGETDDQLFVHLPDDGVLLPGDNFYRTFPNLYTIRGTPYRDVAAWATSLDTIRALKPEFLVPSHTRPLVGAATIEDALRDYRDAIRFVHDQTVRGMNQGLTPDELVEFVQLPAHLAASPYLQEYYGKVSWSVRAIFTGYLGYFDGNPTWLDPLPPDDRSQRMADLAGGVEELRRKAEAAASSGDHPWTLELTDHLLRLDADDEKARQLRIEALTAMGSAESNPNARHYYLTQALELRDGFESGYDVPTPPEMIGEVPMAAIFNSMAVKLNAESSAEVDRRVAFRFPDTGEAFTMHVRRGVAEVQARAADDAEVVVTVDSQVWKEITAGLRNPALAYASGAVKVEGGTLDLVGFLGLFRD